METIGESDAASNADARRPLHDHVHETAPSLVRGVVFGRSVRGSFCVLHLARLTETQQQGEKGGECKQDDEDDKAVPILIRLQFLSDVSGLRSFCRRFCKNGDLLSIQCQPGLTNGVVAEWRSLRSSIETDWQFDRLVVDLPSLGEAQRVLTVLQVRYWTIRQYQTWQNDFLAKSPWGQVSQKQQQQEKQSQALGKETAGTKTASSRPHGGVVAKREEGVFLSYFLIHMVQSKLRGETGVVDTSNWSSRPRQIESAASMEWLNNKGGVLDVAGGMGHLSMALGSAGIRSTVVDPREHAGRLPRRDRKLFRNLLKRYDETEHSCPGPASNDPLTALSKRLCDLVTVEPLEGSATFEKVNRLDDEDPNEHMAVTPPGVPVALKGRPKDYVTPLSRPIAFETYRAWFGTPQAGVDADFRQHDNVPIMTADDKMVLNYTALVALHPDEATDAVVDMAVAHRIPFCVVPCCVFFRLFEDRRVPGSLRSVSTHADLVEYLLGKHPSIQEATLPFEGKNKVLWSTF